MCLFESACVCVCVRPHQTLKSAVRETKKEGGMGGESLTETEADRGQK